MAKTKVGAGGRAQIKSMAEANRALREMAETERVLSVIDARTNEKIGKIKAEAVGKAEPYKRRLKEISEGLQIFAEYNRAEIFSKRQSVMLVFGAFGFRKSTELKPAQKMTWGKVLDRIRDAGFGEAIRVKEEVNRERLREAADEELKPLGVRRVEKETFWIETKREELGGEGA